MVKKIVLLALIALVVVVPLVALGATFEKGEAYYLQPGEVINDNLYAVAGSVVITGTVNGDVLTAGGNITTSGSVSGDMAVAGGNLSIGSDVAGDVRAVGGNVNISKSIGGELVAAGGQINIMPGLTIGKDVSIAGGTVYIDGVINGNLKVAANQIKFGPNAVVNGKFDYYSESTATFNQGAVVKGETNFHKVTMPSREGVVKVGVGFNIVGWVIKMLMTIVAVLVMIYFFRPQTAALLEAPIANFWKEALRGFIVLVVVPIAIIISFITVVGVLVGLIALLFYILFIILASIFSALVFAKLCLKYLFKKENYQLNWWIAVASILVMGVITIIPFVGWIISFILFLSSLGSTSNFVYKKIRS